MEDKINRTAEDESPAAYDKKAERLFYGWLLFAVCSLIFAGIFAFLVAMARTPVIEGLFGRADYIKVALVGHVVLSFVVWFAAFEAGLLVLTGTNFFKTRLFSPFMGWLGLGVSIVGTVIIIISTIFGFGNPQFINYVPVLIHPFFYAGLALLAAGIAVTVINAFITIETIRSPLPVLTFGMFVVGVATFVALICFGLSYLLQREVDLESLFWGGGHILQFANTAAMVTVWIYLTTIVFNRFPLKDAAVKLIYTIFLLFVLPSPLIYALYEVGSFDYLRSFTRIMQFGLGPSTFIFSLAILTVVLSNKDSKGLGIKSLPWGRPEFSSLVMSMGLFLLGGLISIAITGYNTKIPSHYHGVIGAVTMSFMGLTHHLFGVLRKEVYSKKLAALQPYLYGIGQALFVIGMFWAGSHNIARKTFGAEQGLDSIAKILSMTIVGLGGIVAIIGGIIFVLNSMATLLRKEKA